MNTQRFTVLTLFLLGALFAPSILPASPGEDDDQLRQIVAAIEHGWENADGTPFYRHFLGQDGAR